MTTAPAFYGLPHAEVPPLEVTITKRSNRWMLAFVDGDDLAPCAPVADGDDLAILSYVSAYFARAAVWAYARKYIGQGLTVVYRGDLEG